MEGWSSEQGAGNQTGNIRDWWAQLIKPQDQSNDEERAILITYTVWNLWKEKCRRVIDNKARLRMGIWSSGESSKQEPAGGGSIPVLHLPLVKAASNGAFKK